MAVMLKVTVPSTQECQKRSMQSGHGIFGVLFLITAMLHKPKGFLFVAVSTSVTLFVVGAGRQNPGRPLTKMTPVEVIYRKHQHKMKDEKQGGERGEERAREHDEERGRQRGSQRGRQRDEERDREHNEERGRQKRGRQKRGRQRGRQRDQERDREHDEERGREDDREHAEKHDGKSLAIKYQMDNIKVMDGQACFFKVDGQYTYAAWTNGRDQQLASSSITLIVDRNNPDIVGPYFSYPSRYLQSRQELTVFCNDGSFGRAHALLHALMDRDGGNRILIVWLHSDAWLRECFNHHQCRYADCIKMDEGYGIEPVSWLQSYGRYYFYKDEGETAKRSSQE